MRAATGSSPRAWGRCSCSCRPAAPRTVHPHVRGADAASNSGCWLARGSSPRAWGRCRFGCFKLRLLIGSSPRAWGRCDLVCAVLEINAVHPHVRGADALHLHLHRVITRFIPTCVGQMRAARYAAIPVGGSSPRAWGRYSSRPSGRPPPPVHPHVRGADDAEGGRQRGALGSSPRAWGRCTSSTAASALGSGSSPRAWGRSNHQVIRNDQQAVHPHVRGADHKEKSPNGSDFSVHPHVRGADGISLPTCLRIARFIPTCVGQMSSTAVVPAATSRFIPTCVGQMSSTAVVPAATSRFIPTCVGQMSARISARSWPPRFIPTCVGQISAFTRACHRRARFIPTCVGQMCS